MRLAEKQCMLYWNYNSASMHLAEKQCMLHENYKLIIHAPGGDKSKQRDSRADVKGNLHRAGKILEDNTGNANVPRTNVPRNHVFIIANYDS